MRAKYLKERGALEFLFLALFTRAVRVAWRRAAPTD
jgi:hypothetical protein